MGLSQRDRCLYLVIVLGLALQIGRARNYFAAPTTTSTESALASVAATIRLDPNSTLAQDLRSIDHVAADSKVVVTLAAGAKCPRPFLIGRLSGPALVKIHRWTWRNATNFTVWEGTYRVPVGGRYFLEVIALFCDDFFYDFHQLAREATANNHSLSEDWVSSNTSSMAKWMGFDFGPICVENIFHHRLTAAGASIHAMDPLPLREPTGWTGVWWRRPGNDSSSVTQPVFTRVQPRHCVDHVKAQRPPPPDCVPLIDLERLEDYEFRWNAPTGAGATAAGPLTVSRLRQTKPTVICLVGFSHSKNFREAAVRMGINATTTNVTFDHVPATYPEQATPFYITVRSRRRSYAVHPNKCDKLMIGLGQWPASFDKNRPMLLDEYYREIKTMLVKLKQDDSTKHMDIYMRSIHYNPLGFKHHSCGPKDWRNPAVIEAYNVVIERVCQELDVPYLDASHISGHVWDSAPDFNHLGHAAEEAELLYLTAAALGIATP